MISQQSRHCTVELQALPSRIGQVRRIVSAQLRYWHLDPLIERAALGVTELLSNVHRHAEPDKMCTVEMELLLGRLTVSVHDHDPRLPVVQDAELFATSGRGLAMVAAVSENWGVRPHGESGKVVWFTLPASSAAVPKISPYDAGQPQDTGLPHDTGQPYDTGRRPAARGRRSEHAPARSAVAG
ncbi:ATP-binding protein [Streptomyces sp. NPDC012510]|uniref:ATP-binding protein n=1 Tax=Streptomyces sp. NPDC012510 TaxID=3364838 RepID=UPI0036E11CD8